MKIFTIIGARPQFIKAVTISNELKKNGIEEVVLHTGQHFDKNMSDIFFEQLKIKKPEIYLNINSLSHGAMTGRMIEKIEEQLFIHKPDLVIVYGDTNSTFAGALAAKKIHIKVAHIEAGLRSFNMKMPEEINRILTDRISDFLFCPTEIAVKNLRKEGFDNFNSKIFLCGDVMKDAALYFSKFSVKPNFNLPQEFILCTIHREENTNDLSKLNDLLLALNEISKDTLVIIPLHPRTKNLLLKNNFNEYKNIFFCEPLGYLEMIYLIRNSKLVMTDSGGLQKEAYFFNRPLIILREETEWIEIVEKGSGFLTGTNKKEIIRIFQKIKGKTFIFDDNLYGDGNSAKIIVEELIKNKL